MIYARILLDLFFLISIFIFPFWVLLVVGFVALFYFKYFYEFIIVMFLFDVLYGGGAVRVWGIPLFLTFISVVLYIISHHLKERLFLYTD